MKKIMYVFLAITAINLNSSDIKEIDSLDLNGLRLTNAEKRNQKSFEFSAEGKGELLKVTVTPYNDKAEEFLKAGGKTLKVKTAPSGTINKPFVTFHIPCVFYDHKKQKKVQTTGFEVQVHKSKETLTFDLSFKDLKEGEKVCFKESNSLLWNAPATAKTTCPKETNSQLLKLDGSQQNVATMFGKKNRDIEYLNNIHNLKDKIIDTLNDSHNSKDKRIEFLEEIIDIQNKKIEIFKNMLEMKEEDLDEDNDTFSL